MPLEAKNVSFSYALSGPPILSNVDFKVEDGERVALLGSSGCGKSTLSKILAGYIEPISGQVLLDSAPLPKRGFCPVQMVYQHPELSVNPRHKIGKILNEGQKPDWELLRALGIEEGWLSRWPGELSGGELQRICLARVLGPSTRFLICDEISAMLDVITQAQIWELVLNVAEKNRLGLIVVTHNHALAARVCQRTVFLSDLNCPDL